jgi:L-amino acid N-acyltransferase YncA
VPPLIRLATEADAAGVLAIYAPFCGDSPVSFELAPPSLDEMRGRIRATLPRFAWLVCDDGGEVGGYVYARPFRDRPAYQWSAEVTAYVREGRRRGGVGRALYTSLFAILRLQGYYNIFAGITLPNPASVGLHEALGFSPLGVFHGCGYKCGAWHDVGFWELELTPRTPHPEPPRELPRVIGTAGWDAALSAGVKLLRGVS